MGRLSFVKPRPSGTSRRAFFTKGGSAAVALAAASRCSRSVTQQHSPLSIAQSGCPEQEASAAVRQGNPDCRTASDARHQGFGGSAFASFANLGLASARISAMRAASHPSANQAVGSGVPSVR